MPKHFGMKSAKIPKIKVPKVKIKIPKSKELKAILTKIVSVSVEVRLSTLLDAIAWYDTASKVFIQKNPLTSDQIKTYDKAAKAKALGLSTDMVGEKEQALRRAILLYESLWADKWSLPKIDSFYKKLDANRAKLEVKSKKLTEKFSDLLAALNGAFNPSGLKFIVSESSTPQSFDGKDSIVMNNEFAKNLLQQMKVQGVLPVLLNEVHYVTTALSVESDGQNGFGVKLEKYYEKIPEVMQKILAAIEHVPKGKLFKGLAPVPVKVATPKQPKVPGVAPKRHVAKEKVDGLYVVGSPEADLYDLLKTKKLISKKDGIAFLSKKTAKPKTEFRKFVAVGTAAGKMKFEANTVTLI